MTYIATIRQKGQITIPDKIRGELPWLDTGSVIHIIPLNNQVITIQPYREKTTTKTDWTKIWNLISLARSFKGKRGDLASFIIQDRGMH